MRHRVRGSFRLRRPLVATAVSLSVVVLLVLPMATMAAAVNAPSASLGPAQTSSGVTASVTWDGTNINTASTMSSGFQIHFNTAVNLLYTWSSPPSAGISINDARLQIFYFGFALATRDITETVGQASSHIVMNWSTGPLEYVLAGTYRLVASLLDNGTTEWSESFWTQVSAPYYILAAFPIILILIFIYELYGVATVGKYAEQAPPKTTPSASPPAAPPAGETPAAEPPSAAPESDTTSPPPGGTS